jgi:hypothetical protein
MYFFYLFSGIIRVFKILWICDSVGHASTDRFSARRSAEVKPTTRSAWTNARWWVLWATATPIRPYQLNGNRLAHMTYDISIPNNKGRSVSLVRSVSSLSAAVYFFRPSAPHNDVLILISSQEKFGNHRIGVGIQPNHRIGVEIQPKSGWFSKFQYRWFPYNPENRRIDQDQNQSWSNKQNSGSGRWFRWPTLSGLAGCEHPMARTSRHHSPRPVWRREPSSIARHSERRRGGASKSAPSARLRLVQPLRWTSIQPVNLLPPTSWAAPLARIHPSTAAYIQPPCHRLRLPRPTQSTWRPLEFELRCAQLHAISTPPRHRSPATQPYHLQSSAAHMWALLDGL